MIPWSCGVTPMYLGEVCSKSPPSHFSENVKHRGVIVCDSTSRWFNTGCSKTHQAFLQRTNWLCLEHTASLPCPISRNTWETKGKNKLKSLAIVSLWCGTKAKQSTCYPGMWMKCSRGRQNQLPVVSSFPADWLSAFCPLWSINQAAPLPPLWGSAALLRVCHLPQWMREASARITWGHGCSGCNEPDSKQLHRLDQYILITRKTQGELPGTSHEAFYQPKFH